MVGDGKASKNSCTFSIEQPAIMHEDKLPEGPQIYPILHPPHIVGVMGES
ncbi:unnamed protein product [Blumeria hordei]|uniref:Uncharacterized protein n=1 Tax=Blumeria hordei TaxID=2867405 RepID=A0A383UX79_BLUHO|nr:unnamed protein product [Blumeria hordei]